MMAETESSLTQLSVRAFLESLGEKSPAPGGGAAAGVSAATGAALASMVLAYSIRKNTPDAERQHLESARNATQRATQVLAGLIEEDARAYAAFSACGKRPTDAAPDDLTAWEAARQNALSVCLAVPLEMAATGTQVLGVLKAAVESVSSYMLTDLEAAARLLEAGVRSAGCSVQANVPILADQSSAQEAWAQFHDLAETAGAHASTIIERVQGRLKA